MALHVYFDKKQGELSYLQEFRGQVEEVTLNLYESNALLAMVEEYEEGDESYLQLNCFFGDKDHMKRCLGLVKGSDGNIFTDHGERGHRLRLNKACFEKKDLAAIVDCFARAFDDIAIELYTEAQ